MPRRIHQNTLLGRCKLLGHLDKALGPGVRDKPIFPMPENGETCKNVVRSRTLPDVGGGEYDALFHGAPDKPSHLYRAAKNPPAPPRQIWFPVTDILSYGHRLQTW
jgi:hypothetical protein